MTEREPKTELGLISRIYAVAAQKGTMIGVSPIDYLIGILEGQYPMIEKDELMFINQTNLDKPQRPERRRARKGSRPR